jgi:hypothetical protein
VLVVLLIGGVAVGVGSWFVDLEPPPCEVGAREVSLTRLGRDICEATGTIGFHTFRYFELEGRLACIFVLSWIYMLL